jgi:hypothetical protein
MSLDLPSAFGLYHLSNTSGPCHAIYSPLATSRFGSLGNTLIAESISRVEIYHSRARKCVELAEAASDLMSRQYYLQLASVWNDMANRMAPIELPEIATLAFVAIHLQEP